jgi:hypothetical protein
MRLRIVVVVVCAVLVVGAVSSLWAQAEVDPACCFDTTGCAAGLKCCDADSLGMDRCASNIPGVCLAVCAVGGR